METSKSFFIKIESKMLSPSDISVYLFIAYCLLKKQSNLIINPGEKKNKHMEHWPKLTFMI